jgi:hypothetical protein
MNKHNRRIFLQNSAGMLAATLGSAGGAAQAAVIDPAPSAVGAGPAQKAQSVAADEGRKPLRLGLIIDLGKDLMPLSPRCMIWACQLARHSYKISSV